MYMHFSISTVSTQPYSPHLRLQPPRATSCPEVHLAPILSVRDPVSVEITVRSARVMTMLTCCKDHHAIATVEFVLGRNIHDCSQY